MLDLRYLPNTITIFRILLILPFIITLIKHQYQGAFYLFLLAGATDGIDGFLARYFRWTSKTGAFLDPLADKLLMMTSFIALAILEKIPPLLFWIVILRDVVIMSGFGGMLYIQSTPEIKPSIISKMNTLLQIIFIALMLFELAFWEWPVNFINLLMVAIGITAITSLLLYILIGIKHVLYRCC